MKIFFSSSLLLGENGIFTAIVFKFVSDYFNYFLLWRKISFFSIYIDLWKVNYLLVFADYYFFFSWFRIGVIAYRKQFSLLFFNQLLIFCLLSIHENPGMILLNSNFFLAPIGYPVCIIKRKLLPFINYPKPTYAKRNQKII